jgi:hypothetical protein
VLDSRGNIHSYRRKKKDWVTSSNQIITITFDTPIAIPFTYGEKVFGSTTNTYGFVDYADQTSVTLKNVNGAFTGDMTLTGRSSNIQAQAGLVSIVSQTIPLDEYPYWESVSIYQNELEKNEQKKHIKLIDNTYKYDVETEIRRVMNV